MHRLRVLIIITLMNSTNLMNLDAIYGLMNSLTCLGFELLNIDSSCLMQIMSLNIKAKKRIRALKRIGR